MVEGKNNMARFIAKIKKDKYLLLMLTVPVIYLLVFKYYPMTWLSIAFKRFYPFKGFWASPWMGMDNFIDFVSGREFWMLIRNTVVINVMSLVFGFPAPIIFALLLNEIKSNTLKRLTQSISYLPHFISVVVAVGMVFAFLSPTSGPIGRLFKIMGKEPVFFLGSEKHFRTVYIASGIWQQMGWNAIIYIAALAGIDPFLYEAAIVDGAGRWKQTIHITIPSIAPTIIVMLILRMGNLFNIGFQRIYLMGNEMTRQVSEVLSVYVYKKGILESNYGFATAAGLFNSIISLVLVVGANVISKKVTETSLW